MTSGSAHFYDFKSAASGFADKNQCSVDKQAWSLRQKIDRLNRREGLCKFFSFPFAGVRCAWVVFHSQSLVPSLPDSHPETKQKIKNVTKCKIVLFTTFFLRLSCFFVQHPIPFLKKNRLSLERSFLSSTLCKLMSSSSQELIHASLHQKQWLCKCKIFCAVGLRKVTCHQVQESRSFLYTS